jgi:tryptophanyl-tRNA synthetase
VIRWALIKPVKVTIAPYQGLKRRLMLKRIHNNLSKNHGSFNMSTLKKRLLTGDTPTGPLHLGHWTGSLEQRVALQNEYNAFFIIANTHAFTTGAYSPEEIRKNTLEIAIDYLSVGIDPKKSCIFVQSDIPAIFELTFMMSMYVPFTRVMRNPTIKNEIKVKGLGDNYPFGFLLYPVGQAADILSFRPHVVPVGEDQIPHIELTKEIARHLNREHSSESNSIFPTIEPLMGRNKRLVGLGAPDHEGQLLKMSKSLNNAIFLKDNPDVIRAKIMKMYTDPNRIRVTDRGSIENNPLWIFLDTFSTDKAWVEDAKIAYQNGLISDVVCKKKLIDAVVELTEPFRQRRKLYESDIADVFTILQDGAARANMLANETLGIVKSVLKQDYKMNHHGSSVTATA